MWGKWVIRWKNVSWLWKIADELNKKRETERMILTRDLNWRYVSKWYQRRSAVKKKCFQVLQQNSYKNMTCCEEQWLWFSGTHRKKCPTLQLKKPILSKITDSVNVRIINLNMPISFSAIKELSVKHLFLENNQCRPQGPTSFGMFTAPHLSERTKSLGRKLMPVLENPPY